MKTAAAAIIEVINPATGLVIGSVPKQGRLEAAKAVDAASSAFKEWSARTAEDRGALLMKWHQLINESEEELLPDADLAKAVDGLIASKYRNAGQTCICANRIFVHEACAAAFTEKLAAFRLTVLLGPVYLRTVALLLMQRDRVPF
ncbi:hypothetical protein BA724_03780 [Domibacillus iocasae]|uniref:Aldehyde dehydrogenase domain-containing protein n=1 Tax=Domibacillus iocasae TaxID=1714016 RepID=A0A1E7DQ17_9BACI|nr:hypothetical protein BA724_03780 [Domibacillus iocasae]